jgi:non-ribosomal peptide synthetase component E (peptide arylation enzyme)
MISTAKPAAANLIERTQSAYSYRLLIYRLLIKHLLQSVPADAADQEIVYRDLRRLDYRSLRLHIGQLATGLARLGVKPATRWQFWTGTAIVTWSAFSRCP